MSDEPRTRPIPGGEELAKVWAFHHATNDAQYFRNIDTARRGIAKIKADALREVARGYWGVDGDPDYPGTSGNVRRILNARADRIEEEA